MSKKEVAIKVTAGEHVVVVAYGMFDDEVYDVRYVIDDNKCDIKDALDVPFAPNGAAEFISPARNPIVLTIPGYYRFVPRGVVNDNAKLFHNAVPAPSCK